MNVINEMKTKTQGDTTKHPLEWLRLKKKKAKTSKVEKLLAGIWTGTTTLENNLAVLCKIKLPLDLAIPLLGGKKWKHYVQRPVHKYSFTVALLLIVQNWKQYKR